MRLATEYSFDGVIHAAFMTPGSEENEAKKEKTDAKKLLAADIK